MRDDRARRQGVRAAVAVAAAVLVTGFGAPAVANAGGQGGSASTNGKANSQTSQRASGQAAGREGGQTAGQRAADAGAQRSGRAEAERGSSRGSAGDTTSPQPPSRADQNTGGANGDCVGSAERGAYCSTRDGSPSGNGNGNGEAAGKPCAGCVGKADNKNPPGPAPGGSDRNAGYECDRNHGIGRTNPAHTGCADAGADADTRPRCALRPERPLQAPGHLRARPGRRAGLHAGRRARRVHERAGQRPGLHGDDAR